MSSIPSASPSASASASSAPQPAKRSRGRKPMARVPCDECIQRASAKKSGDESDLELCEKCRKALSLRPGSQPSKRQEDPNVRRVRRQGNPIIDNTLTARSNAVGLPWSKDRQEQHSLQFFVQHSAPQLAGYFDSYFWQRTLLQAGRHEPAVRHAIAAVGALHEKLLTGAVNPDESQDKRTRFALEQCNKSIQHLIKPGQSKNGPDLGLMLTTCVLFTCFEALQGHCEQAIIHATQGYSLLQQYAMDPENKRWDVGSFAVELNQLVLIMRRLQTQSKALMSKDYNVIPDAQQIKMQKPTRFNSIQEARVGLEMVLNRLTVFFLDLELDDQYYDLVVSTAEKHLLFGPWLRAWEEAFSTFLSTYQATLSPQDRKGAMVLKAHHLVAEILSDVDLSLGELAWDAFHDKFVAIVELGAAILEGDRQSDTSVLEARWKANGVFISASNATLSFSLGIVDPLYEVCARCRDPVLRRRALDLLARHPRQECMWSSWTAWKVGKFLMREEEGSGQIPTTAADISIERRISEAWIDFSGASGAFATRPKVQFKRAVRNDNVSFILNPGLFDSSDMKPTGEGYGSETADTRSYLFPENAEDLMTPEWASGDNVDIVSSGEDQK